MTTPRPARIAIVATSFALPVAAAVLAGRSYLIFQEAAASSYDACIGDMARAGDSAWQCAIHSQDVAASTLELSSAAEWAWLTLLMACCWYAALGVTAAWSWMTKPSSE